MSRPRGRSESLDWPEQIHLDMRESRRLVAWNYGEMHLVARHRGRDLVRERAFVVERAAVRLVNDAEFQRRALERDAFEGRHDVRVIARSADEPEEFRARL